MHKQPPYSLYVTNVDAELYDKLKENLTDVGIKTAGHQAKIGEIKTKLFSVAVNKFNENPKSWLKKNGYM